MYLHLHPSNVWQLDNLGLSFDLPIESPTCPSKTFIEPGLKQPNSIVDYLRKLHTSKGYRFTLKGLDYDVSNSLEWTFFFQSLMVM